jgi:hypothetical protein
VNAGGVGVIRRRMAVAWAVALVLGAAAYGTAHHAYATLPHAAPFGELDYYPSGRYLRPAVLGHAETAADLAWLRAAQYYGEHRHSDNNFTNLDHVFDVLTALSPRFESAYVFGSFALAQEGRRFDLAERLMLAGLENNPTSGRLAFEAGFLYFVKPGGRDLRRAADYFQLATHLPGAPPSSARFAAFCRQNSGDLRVAWELWSEVLATSQNQYMREAAAREMARIQAALASGRREAALDRISTPRVIFRPSP